MKKIYEIQISVFLKFYCNMTVPVCSHIAYGSFDAMTADLSSAEGDCPGKSKIFTVWPVTEKVCQLLSQLILCFQANENQMLISKLILPTK